MMQTQKNTENQKKPNTVVNADRRRTRNEKVNWDSMSTQEHQSKSNALIQFCKDTKYQNVIIKYTYQ